MEKVIKVLNAEIEKLKASIEADKSLIISGLDDIKVYNNALKVIGPKLEALEKLDKVLSFIKQLDDNQIVEKPISKRGRPKKVKCN